MRRSTENALLELSAVVLHSRPLIRGQIGCFTRNGKLKMRLREALILNQIVMLHQEKPTKLLSGTSPVLLHGQLGLSLGEGCTHIHTHTHTHSLSPSPRLAAAGLRSSDRISAGQSQAQGLRPGVRCQAVPNPKRVPCLFHSKLTFLCLAHGRLSLFLSKALGSVVQ